MGHFSATCALSNLAIPGDTLIRVLLLTRNPYGEGWDLRAPPIRAVYNDYGGIEKVHPDDMPIVDLWLRGLNVDLVERGVGNNQVHDVPTRRGMTFDALCDALSEGRVLVRQDTQSFWRPQMKGLGLPRSAPEEWRANMANVERVLGDLVPKLNIDEPIGNVVRVRVAGYGDGAGLLEAAQERLSGIFAVAKTAGSGSCGFSAELLVFTLPGSERHFAGPVWENGDKDRHLPVSWAFVRSDIWDGLVATTRKNWYDTGTIDEAIARVCTKYAEMGTSLLFSVLHEGREPHFTDYTTERGELFRSVPGVIGMDEHMALLKMSGLSEAQTSHILDAIAETVHVNGFMHDARRAWSPEGRRGSQDPEWNAQLRVLRVIMETTKRAKRER